MNWLLRGGRSLTITVRRRGSVWIDQGDHELVFVGALHLERTADGEVLAWAYVDPAANSL